MLRGSVDGDAKVTSSPSPLVGVRLDDSSRRYQIISVLNISTLRHVLEASQNVQSFRSSLSRSAHGAQIGITFIFIILTSFHCCPTVSGKQEPSAYLMWSPSTIKSL